MPTGFFKTARRASGFSYAKKSSARLFCGRCGGYTVRLRAYSAYVMRLTRLRCICHTFTRLAVHMPYVYAACGAYAIRLRACGAYAVRLCGLRWICGAFAYSDATHSLAVGMRLFTRLAAGWAGRRCPARSPRGRLFRAPLSRAPSSPVQ